MRRTIGYIVAPLVVGMLVVLVASGCSKEAGPQAGPATKAAKPEPPKVTYAELTKKVDDFVAKFKEATENLPAGVPAPPLPPITFLSTFVLKDTGTVVSMGTSPDNKPVANIDLTGDGQPELAAKFSSGTVPAGVQAGAKVDVTSSIVTPRMQDGKLTISGVAQSCEVVGGGS